MYFVTFKYSSGVDQARNDDPISPNTLECGELSARSMWRSQAKNKQKKFLSKNLRKPASGILLFSRKKLMNNKYSLRNN